MKQLSSKLRFRTLPALPIDTQESGPRTVQAIFACAKPTPVKNPVLVCASQPALDLLEISTAETDEFLEVFSGNQIIPGSVPLAHCYCGFQFGVFAGQLGDGAAILLGTTHSGWELGLKGSGLTQFSRFADGRKVLRSSIREFLASEAMHALGIPSTRSASIIVSDDRVWRDLMYDGHAKQESCAVISRIARSFIRFGSFEIARSSDPHRRGPCFEDPQVVMKLLDYVRTNYYDGCSTEDFVRQVTVRTAELVAQWQSIGFCHGVLNTDNMSIIGDTMDYGPYAFMEQYDSSLVANTSDRGGRYAFRNQPAMCKWNCLVLADSIEEVFGRIDGAPEISSRLTDVVNDTFAVTFENKYRELMRRKLRLRPDSDDTSADDVIAKLLRLLEDTSADYTNTMYSLSTSTLKSNEWNSFVSELIPLQQFDDMPNINPRFILRNYLIQEAIEDAENGDYSQVKRLLKASLDPFNPSIEPKLTTPQPPSQVCTSLSCSSLQSFV